ncbi:Dynein light chain Tctex-type [Yarrowia sp. C11]|nr:Dynein light chain Tctex-type [Yarrowia sp. E02]KAG5372839.1 Dynein light chain Tctex-type [Yarrowia sp. C11]
MSKTNNHEELHGNMPLSQSKLTEIIDSAASSVVGTGGYSHSDTSKWNSQIIAKVLEALKDESKGFKFLVHSTLVEVTDHRPGIKSSTGGFWNTEKDGVWNYKWTNDKVDVLVSVAWIHSSV